MESEKEISLQERFQQLLGSSSMGGDDEKLLELASSFSVQLSASQIRILLALNMFGDILELEGNRGSLVIRNFIKKFIELKKFHGSDFFVMRALDSVSLRRFMQEKPIGVDVIKK